MYRYKRSYESYRLKRNLGVVLLVLLFFGGFVGQDLTREVKGVEEKKGFWAEEIAGGKKIAVVDDGKRMEMPLEEYLIGVVAAEMPASFHKEALKAQAVAARTYALRWLEKNESIPADASVAQSWIDEEEMKRRWGKGYEENYTKVARAVLQTQGQVLVWQGDLIESLYHASCGGGYTASAQEVWGGNVMYLRSVDCNHGKDKFSDLETDVQGEVLDELFGVGGNEVMVKRHSVSGRAEEILLGEEICSGETFRSKLGLKSAMFQIKYKDDGLIITTQGYGHGVGMCQYGADYYGKKGWDYKEILLHYYTDVQIVTV